MNVQNYICKYKLFIKIKIINDILSIFFDIYKQSHDNICNIHDNLVKNDIFSIFYQHYRNILNIAFIFVSKEMDNINKISSCLKSQ